MSDGNSTTSHQTQTTPPPNPPPQPPPKTTSFPVRDDCWSDEATFTLIEAWGDKIVKYNSNSLRQIHWLEVSDAVNGRHGHVKKGRRTDVQCKNRIDTLKKKYKVEKAKTELALNNNNSTYVSNWKFFQPLDLLIGSSFKSSAKTPKPRIHRRKRIDDTPPELPELPPPSSVPVGRRSKRPPPPAYRPLSDGSFFRRNFSVMAAAAAAEEEDEEDSDASLSSSENLNRIQQKRDRKGRFVGEEEETCRELAEAIVRFAEVYERVEEAKQRQIVELEKQRMQFTKDLEIERMKVFMESQVQLGKLKRLKGDSVAGKERMNEKLNEIPQSEQSYLSNGQVILHRSFYKIKSL